MRPPERGSQEDETAGGFVTVHRTHIIHDDACTRRRSAQCDGVRDSRVRSWGLLSGLLAVLGLVVGCGDSNGGTGNESAEASAVVQVDPVYLEPGVTSVTLEWAASLGAVDNYLVFESRNGSAFDYSEMTLGPSVQVEGEAGESVQITVVAVSPSGQLSESSAPSVPIIFQAAASAAVAIAPAPSGAAPLMAPTSTGTAEPLTQNNEIDAASAERASSQTPTTEDPLDSRASATDETATQVSSLATRLKEVLLLADARLPIAALSDSVATWLQTHVDSELGPQFSLVGTGHDDADTLSELVLQDDTGRLFVSDGSEILEAADLRTTPQAGLQLGLSERFVGLLDLNGDAVADWLIEETDSALVWIVDGASGDAAVVPALGAGHRLVGLGDFDGNGWSELLWRSEESLLTVTDPSPEAAAETPAPKPNGVVPAHLGLLAIADFDGDGRDDLLGLSEDGTVEVGLATSLSGADRLNPKWLDTGLSLAEGRELVATLDSDGDGKAELLLLSNDRVERADLRL
jgi:hypothetical protein